MTLNSNQSSDSKMGNVLGTGKEDKTADCKSVLLQKLQDIPLQQLQELLTNQIDLEIQLKHKELTLLNRELQKIEAQMILLRNFFEIPPNTKLENEPDDFTTRYFELLNNSLTVSYNELKRRQQMMDNAGYGPSSYSYGSDDKVLFNSDFLNDLQSLSSTPNLSTANSSNVNSPVQVGHGHIYRTRSTTSSLRPSAYGSVPGNDATGNSPCGLSSRDSAMSSQTKSVGCFYRRTDGIIVKLTCPECQRSNFSSAQGFLNHSRIAHSKEFTSQDAAALKCGAIIESIKQDQQGESSIRSLLQKNLDPARNLNVNEVYFNPNLNSVISSSCTPSQIKEKSRSPKFVETTPEKPKETPSVESSILFKKIKNTGKMNKAEFEKLFNETKNPIVNSHLFDDEEDEEEEPATVAKSETPSAESYLSHKRRKSRGGINIITGVQHIETANVESSSESTNEEVSDAKTEAIRLEEKKDHKEQSPQTPKDEIRESKRKRKRTSFLI